MKYCEVLHQNLHLQGFTFDGDNMYWSFTDSLVKTTRNGTVKRQVPVLAGHLGDIDYCDGKIYGSVMGNSLKGKPWGIWTSFEVNVYDAATLTLERIIRLDECYSMYENRIDGFNGIDGISVIPATADSPARMMVASALFDGEAYDKQIILEYTLDGVLIKKHHIKTGNTIFGIQNLDRDPSTGNYWFTTYGGDRFPYQNKNFLFCVSPDLTKVIAEYNFCTPYGFHCLGDGRYYVSLQAGVNTNRSGYAYEATDAFIKNTEISGENHNLSFVSPWFDKTIGL